MNRIKNSAMHRSWRPGRPTLCLPATYFFYRSGENNNLPAFKALSGKHSILITTATGSITGANLFKNNLAVQAVENILYGG